MDIKDVAGPGITPWIIERLQSWNINFLTDIQTKAVEAGIANGQSMVVSAPTSTGKTLVGELAVLATISSNTRVIYLVSHKALADQKYVDFKSKLGEEAPEPITSVGLNTGDRAEGDINAQLMVATYEKALGLILSNQLKPTEALIVADELQIIGESGRGPQIETLCTVFKQRGYRQFVALSATVENPGDLAGWMGCKLIQSFHRDVPLHQQIWFNNQVFQTTFGQDEGGQINDSFKPAKNVIDVVTQLLDLKRGPVLVFTESRREATEYALEFAKSRPRAGDGVVISEQLDLFSEPTESSQQLRENAERRVTFHSADLSPQERQVIETGFLESKFEVCYATSTLAAGVNFPFRTIVFPKLTFQWGSRAGSHITLSDYRNMSGRAGRLGMHEDGYAVLLPSNFAELTYAKKLVGPTNENFSSQLIALSLRKTILMLASSRLATSIDEVTSFFKETLYWYQTLETNPKLLEILQSKTTAAISWLIQHGLLEGEAKQFNITRLGNSAAISGLLPATVVQLVKVLNEFSTQMEQSFEDWIDGLLYTVCASEEFKGERPSRFLPWPNRRSYDSFAFWESKNIPVPIDRTDTQLSQCAQAIALYVNGMGERKIAHLSMVSSGSIHRLAIDVAWVLDGMHKLTVVPELGCPQTLGNKIAMLARRVRWGVPTEALDIIRIAQKHNVPGFGRQRATALISQGIVTAHDILIVAKSKLVEILRNDQRAQALIDAVSSKVDVEPNRLAATHIQVAKNIDAQKNVKASYNDLGTDYEKAIQKLLEIEASWIVTVLDDGIRQNVPDLMVKMNSLTLLIECKTSSKSPSIVKKEDAWAILQKAADFDKEMKRITLGKTSFDESAKSKCIVSQDFTLVEHSVFIEGLLRVHLGSLEPLDFLKWLSMPGVADIERLGGTPSYST
ncbi:MAG: DEAD/DEAH box helicase [Candidatus Electrothrix sp. LOE1_4_5]|nr:DEAD/DEAH box helicase [Candidatus Electrothrix gigas]